MHLAKHAIFMQDSNASYFCFSGLANSPGAGQVAQPPEVMEVVQSGKEVCEVILGENA